VTASDARPAGTPAFSVVLPTCDRPRLLRDAVASVARQSHAPLELRIVDDGEVPPGDVASTDGLLNLVVLRSGMHRLAAARNIGTRDAAGEVIAYLDDDDRWLPDHLAGFAKAFRDPALMFAYRDVAVVREAVAVDGTRRELERRVIARDWDPEWMRHDDFIAPSAWAIRRELFDRLGGFDETFAFSEDWEFLMRATKVTTPRRVPGVTVEVRMRDSGNLSAERGELRQECLDRIAERFGLEPIVIKTFWDVAGELPAARTA
jgi:glycosyltransferase involved in cell wall biosynthesis